MFSIDSFFKAEQQYLKVHYQLVVFMDVEATGRSVLNDHVVQIAACADLFKYQFKNNKIHATHLQDEYKSWCTYVYTSREMHYKASEITGITNKMLKGKPTFNIVWHKFVTWVKSLCSQANGITFVAYNGNRYDFPILKNECLRNAVSWLPTMFSCPIEFYDPLSKARSCIVSPKYTLGCVYYTLFKKKIENAHDALADTTALRQICLHPKMKIIWVHVFQKMPVKRCAKQFMGTAWLEFSTKSRYL